MRNVWYHAQKDAYNSTLHKNDKVPEEIRLQHPSSECLPRPRHLRTSELPRNPCIRPLVVVEDVLPPVRAVHILPRLSHCSSVLRLVGLVDKSVIHYTLGLDVR
jgi:hypothetical protein